MRRVLSLQRHARLPLSSTPSFSPSLHLPPASHSDPGSVLRRLLPSLRKNTVSLSFAAVHVLISTSSDFSHPFSPSPGSPAMIREVCVRHTKSTPSPPPPPPPPPPPRHTAADSVGCCCSAGVVSHSLGTNDIIAVLVLNISSCQLGLQPCPGSQPTDSPVFPGRRLMQL